MNEKTLAANREITAKKPRGRPFEKGNNANPSGRPKQTKEQKDALTAIRELAPTAAETLKEMMTNAKTPANVRAKLIEIVLNRTYGMPNVAVKLEQTDYSEFDKFMYGQSREKNGS